MGLVDRVHRLRAKRGMALLSLVLAFGSVALLIVISGSSRLRHLRAFSQRLEEKRKWRMKAQSALAEGLSFAKRSLKEGTYRAESSIADVEVLEIAVGKPKRTIGLAMGQLVIAVRVATPRGKLVSAQRRAYSIRLKEPYIARRPIQSSEEVQR